MRTWNLFPALLTVLFFLPACGGGVPGTETAEVVARPGIPPAQGGTTKPPVTPIVPAVTFDPTFVDLGKAGAFPSDLATDDEGSLYTMDDAAIPARILRYGATGSRTSMSITAADLIDDDGTQPATAVTAFDFAGGLFGAFTGDVEVARNRWIFVTVGAGNSLSTSGSDALSLSNLVVLDSQSGTVVQTINLAWTANVSGNFNVSGPFDGLPQSLPSQVSFVPDPGSPNRGRLYVAMSNGAGSSNGLSAWYPGTVQIWLVDFERDQPVYPELSGRNPVHPTRLFVSSYYNPVGMTIYSAPDGVDFLLLTNAGASRFDANFNALPEGEAVIEVLDLASRRWRPGLEMNLGAILPASQKLALGHDENGRSFAALSSQTYSAAYIVDLAGLDARPARADQLGLLHTVDLAANGSVTPGSGFHPGIGISRTSRTVVVSTFFPAKLFLLDLPSDIVTGTVLVDVPPFDNATLTASASGGLGALIVPQNSAADVYFLANGTFDFSTFLPKDNAFLGTLTTRDGLR